MMKKVMRYRIQLSIYFAILLMTQTALAQLPKHDSLSKIIEEAIAHNPSIQEALNQWEAAQHKINTVKSLDEPMFGYMFPGGEDVQTRVGPQIRRYTLSQKVPFPYKLDLKGKAQAKEAEILKELYESVKNKVIMEVKFTYYDLFWVEQSIQINEEEKSLLEKLEKVTQRKYESNRISQQDVIKVQVELSDIIQTLILLNQNKESLIAKLNSLLNKPMAGPFSRITKIGEVTFEYDLPALIDMVADRRQELVMANLSVEQAEYERTLAKMEYLPDFTIGGQYIEVEGGMTNNANDGQDAWMGMIEVDVPIWFGKLRSQVKEKESALKAAEENLKNTENVTEFEVQDVYYKIKAYKDIVLLYETALIPQAEQAFDASQTGFETGAISFLDWLDTQRTFLRTRLAYFKAITDFHKSVADLERIVGGNLKGGQND